MVLEKILKEKNEKSIVTLVDATKLYQEEMSKNVNQKTHYTPYIFLRLLIDKMKELPDKMLYLDTDIICYKDIKEIYDTDITNYEIAAAKDYIGKTWMYPNYLNSGVLLINLTKIRETNSFENCRKVCMTKRMGMPDQSALNECCKDKLILPDKFNEQHKRVEDTVLRHFSMHLLYFPIIHPRNIKPWEIDKVHKKLKIHDYDDIYEEFLKIKSGFSNLQKERVNS